MPGLFAITLLLILAKGILVHFSHAGPLETELEQGWVWMAICIPLTLVTNWLRGALEGEQRFARVNLLRTVFGAWNYAAPALVVLVWPTLDAMIEVLAVGRLLALLAHAWACWQVAPGIIIGHAPRRWSSGRLLFQEGGWITVSNLVGPLMVYSDRFVLAALLPPRAVAWYVTSQDVMLRTLMIPSALAGALFPQFSGTMQSKVGVARLDLYRRSIRVISAIMLPICMLSAVLAYDALRLWLGESFGANSHRVVEIIAIGIFVNSIANLPFAWLQGLGRSYIVARIHMIELPAYALGLYFLVGRAGIEGAAWMWTIRCLMDCLAMLAIAEKDFGRASMSMVALGAPLILLAGCLTGPERPWQWRIGFAAVACAVSLLIAWYVLLNRDDRNQIGRLRHAN